ncbi:hypothetical protein [Nocardia tengchongensis]|uniref:hypothetical protein n=1 Tax=Nocardia tengchongensis TaxID=2055889 RepID=UPI003622A44D
MGVQVESVESEAARAVNAALTGSFVAGVCFVALTWTTTQAKSVRSASPWQTDPYDVVVSFTEFVVPAMLLLMALRMLLWRTGRHRSQPAFRAAQLVRAATATTGLVAVTVASDWIAVVVGANHAVWTKPTTPVLIGALAVLTAATAAGLMVQRKAVRQLLPDRSHDGDWLDDIEPLATRLWGGRAVVGPVCYRSITAFIRRHDIAVPAAAAMAAGTAIAGLQAHGEKWTDPTLVLFAVVVATSGFFGMAMLVNHLIVFITPASPLNRKGRAVRAAVTAAALGIPAAVAVRATLFYLLGGVIGHTPSGLLLLVTGCGVIVGTLTFAVGMASARS